MANLSSKKLTKCQVQLLDGFSERLCRLASKFEGENDVMLDFGNGSVSEQLDIALAAIDTILQEYE